MEGMKRREGGKRGRREECITKNEWKKEGRKCKEEEGKNERRKMGKKLRGRIEARGKEERRERERERKR